MSKRLLPKAYAALILYLALFPLYLLPAAALLPGREWIAALLPLPALLLTGGAGFMPAKRRTAALLISIALVAAGCAFLFLPISPPGLLLFLPCLFTMLSFMPALARPAHREWTASHLIFGIVLHIAAQFLKGVGIFLSAAAPVSWVFAAYLAACLFYINRTMLADTGPSASKTLLFHNRRLLAVLCLSSLLLANLKAAGAAVRAAIAWIITAIANFIVWATSLLQTDEAAPTETGNLFDALGDTSEPSQLSKVIEIILSVLAALVAAALLFFALKYFIRLLRKAFRALSERLKLYRRRISADYDDQSESLLDWGEIRKTAKLRLDRLRKRYMPVPWEKLSPAQRVRRVYALMLRRAENPNPALTAREMLQSGAMRLKEGDAAPAASLYERARYSGHPIAAHEADDLRRRAGV